MLKTNVHPYVYMSKYAMKHFAEKAGEHSHRNALIYVSSLSSMGDLPYFTAYAGTKTHNYITARLVNSTCKKSSQLKDLVEVQTLHPGAVSTNLCHFAPLDFDVVTTEACVKPALCDLGMNRMSINGAFPH